MKQASEGFGLIEIMLAMTLGLVITLGLTQLFIGAKNTYISQNASAFMQEDARFLLSKMLQEIRMVGMFGCLQTIDDSGRGFSAARQTPIRWNNAKHTLTLVTADVGTTGGKADWVVLSDCESSATAYAGDREPGPGQLKFPIRQITYAYDRRGGEISGLIKNVSAFSVLFGVANTVEDTPVSRYAANPADPRLIRSVRLSLTLSDPAKRVEDQTFTVVAALRNRLG
ncbi:pilus assembly protein PilW [Pseudomonas sp. CCI3.2]|uniref:PilW family protein n=1 Tax=unclassified Pseudomonas TaxID=196821 RepID=UPI002AC994FF|nr:MULTISPECIES: pilus assembly protein PilW [unclassified Pseudomonas]MEB0076774.1 pilus assembly protein PilW [Pseudomonas sp. MH10out]MEB0090980.1 pilus assembly protein PilW [Pseudomonas sp. CCI4.2]MEB0101907.1 pilus assembly protein PilW [Pseudomonas sp. CCI3.2]MEB0121865.1 pilus assembly protein PilW [Pseudomonas sp. CCI1.2]MEB0131106.1 pilus assembly protein PilW [Pseudomonas sp. CCI2.4]